MPPLTRFRRQTLAILACPLALALLTGCGALGAREAHDRDDAARAAGLPARAGAGTAARPDDLARRLAENEGTGSVWRSGDLGGRCSGDAAAPVVDEIAIEAVTLFDTGSARLRPAGERVLDQLVERIGRYDAVREVVLRPQADGRGPRALNDALARGRGASVRRYLEARLDPVPPLREAAPAEPTPVGPGTDAASLQAERRVVARVIADDVRPGRGSIALCAPAGGASEMRTIRYAEPGAVGLVRFGGSMPLSPGDRLRLRVIGDETLDGLYEIGPGGALDLPFVGAVPARGLRAPELEARLERRLIDGGFVRPAFSAVDAAVLQWAIADVYVRGAVFYPGRKTINVLDPQERSFRQSQAGGDAAHGRLLSAALRAAGGVRPDADLSAIRVRRAGEFLDVDLSGIVTGHPAEDIALVDGDEVEVASLGLFQPALVRADPDHAAGRARLPVEPLLARAGQLERRGEQGRHGPALRHAPAAGASVGQLHRRHPGDERLAARGAGEHRSRERSRRGDRAQRGGAPAQRGRRHRQPAADARRRHRLLRLRGDEHPRRRARGRRGADALRAAQDAVRQLMDGSRFLRPAATRSKRYGILAALGLGAVWVPVALYLILAPDLYRSQASLLIPGSGIGSTLNVDSLGQASTSVASPYSSASVDPKVNYKAIMTSATVLDAAARHAGLPPHEYGRPRVKLVDQTSIIAIVFEADTAEGARLRTAALQRALEEELDRLRTDERTRVRSSNAAQLDEYQRQMGEAQARLLDFQASAGTVSAEQLGDLLAAIERLRARRSELDLELASGRGRMEALTVATGLPPERSAEVVRLQRDRVLLSLLENHSGLRAEYLDASSVLGPGNPRVALLASRTDAAETALRERAAEVLGFVDDAFVDRFLPSVRDDSPSVFRELVELGAEVAADTSEREALDELIASSEASVQTSAQKAARFDELERGYRVAETVFLSALAKIDLGESDVFASYPMTQTLVAPTLPSRPERLYRLLALLGAVAGTGFVLLALGILWKRDEWLRRHPRSA